MGGKARGHQGLPVSAGRNMTESIKVSATLAATPQRVYKAWLSSEEHGAFTGGQAVIDPKVGDKFSSEASLRLSREALDFQLGTLISSQRGSRPGADRHRGADQPAWGVPHLLRLSRAPLEGYPDQQHSGASLQVKSREGPGFGGVSSTRPRR